MIKRLVITIAIVIAVFVLSASVYFALIAWVIVGLILIADAAIQ